MIAADIGQKLRGRKSGTQWMVCCPVHEDRNPSLSLRDAGGGRVLVHCHAGCSQNAVIESLKVRGLWPELKVERNRRIVDVYNYEDESRALLYQVVRTEPKGFFQRRPDGRGGFVNRRCERQVLYRLREVLEAPIVFVVEGEKDVETLRSRGFVATTNAGGARKPWLPQYTAWLRGKEVILIPDNDAPGRQRVLTIARALLGHATRVIILKLDGGKDITDWFEAGHSELELIALIEAEGTK
jgi:putative DNA primase/helicase